MDKAELQEHRDVLSAALGILSTDQHRKVYPSTAFMYNVTRKYLREAIASLDAEVATLVKQSQSEVATVRG